MADTVQVLMLAAIIREVDGNHSKGAAALAESILDHPSFHKCCNVHAFQADGEVAELAEWLCAIAADLRDTGFRAERLIRAAELLQRQVLVPVGVSERPPEDQLCWWFEPDEEDDEAYGSSWTLLRICGGTSSYTHWLPAHALPLPDVNNG